ncbi:hypothetical protein STXM2123_3915 [Streptomyces sp. F-3]|nr:hypothetical protein STXM2123_3915 [Streptomyces sp. F-3]
MPPWTGKAAADCRSVLDVLMPLNRPLDRHVREASCHSEWPVCDRAPPISPV